MEGLHTLHTSGYKRRSWDQEHFYYFFEFSYTISLSEYTLATCMACLVFYTLIYKIPTV